MCSLHHYTHNSPEIIRILRFYFIQGQGSLLLFLIITEANIRHEKMSKELLIMWISFCSSFVNLTNFVSYIIKELNKIGTAEQSQYDYVRMDLNIINMNLTIFSFVRTEFRQI